MRLLLLLSLLLFTLTGSTQAQVQVEGVCNDTTKVLDTGLWECVDPDTPPPPPPPTGACVSTRPLVYDVDGDGSLDADLWGVTSPSQANDGNFMHYNEVGFRPDSLEGRVAGYATHYPGIVYPPITVRSSDFGMVLGEGATYQSISIERHGFCIVGDVSNASIATNGFSGTINGVAQ